MSDFLLLGELSFSWNFTRDQDSMRDLFYLVDLFFPRIISLGLIRMRVLLSLVDIFIPL